MESMAVEAPTLATPVNMKAHVPHVNGPVSNGSGKVKSNGTGANVARKRDDSSSEDEKPLAKKARPATNGKRQSTASTSNSDLSDDDKPLANKANGRTHKKTNYDEDDEETMSASSSESSDSDAPLAKKKPAKPRASTSSSSKVKTSSSKAKSENAISSSDEDEKPLAKKANGRAKKAVKKEPVSSEEDDKPLAKKTTVKASGKVKKEKDERPTKKEKKVKEEEEDVFRWWDQNENDGSVKWKTLVHNAVLFPPPYVPLPKGVKMKYDGKELTLPPESEEVAGFYAAMLGTDHVQDKVFQTNFFRDFKATLEEHPPKEGIKVTSLERCDFTPMFEHFEREKEKKKSMTKEEKKAIKEAKDALEKPYLYAEIDGRKEKAGNFRAEPPGLFRGRGEHPRKGTLKKRLRPEDIIINIGKDAPVPVPNIPGQWKAIQHDDTVTWLAHWKENVNNQAKYVFLSAGSAWKGQSDRAKFEKARELIKHIDKIRKDYTVDLKSKITADRQRATALYFIDRLALRAGNEKGEDEADTVGCCSLRYEHVTLEPPNKVTFDFLGKDSMRFHQEVEVDQQVFKNIKIFKQPPKTKGDDLFDRLNTAGLNKYLNDQMKGLTAKVFRTYNASWTFQNQLKNTPKVGSVQEKIAAYNTANREVAILCNHQKTVSKGFEQSFAKMGDKVRALKYQRMKLRYQLFVLEPKMKKRHPELAEEESDMDDEFMERHEDELLEKALDQAQKKFDRDNVKLEENKEEKKPKSDLNERLKEIKAEFKALAKERKTKQVEPKKGFTAEKLMEQIGKMDDRIAAAKVQMSDRDKTKDVALSTSKINYIDPRITVAWAKKYEVPLEKLFSKTLREKFPWAEAEADEDWVF